MIRAHLNGQWFTATPATKDCAGCLFDAERSSVCRAAGDAAIAAGLPDCEAGFVYVPDPSDGRQLDLIESAK